MDSLLLDFKLEEDSEIFHDVLDFSSDQCEDEFEEDLVSNGKSEIDNEDKETPLLTTALTSDPLSDLFFSDIETDLPEEESDYTLSRLIPSLPRRITNTEQKKQKDTLQSRDALQSKDALQDIRDAVEKIVSADQRAQESLLSNTSLTPSQRKQLRNKISARNFRTRRKHLQIKLEQEVKQVRQTNALLLEKIAHLESTHSPNTKQLDNENYMWVKIPAQMKSKATHSDIEKSVEERRLKLDYAIKKLLNARQELPLVQYPMAFTYPQPVFQHPHPYLYAMQAQVQMNPMQPQVRSSFAPTFQKKAHFATSTAVKSKPNQTSQMQTHSQSIKHVNVNAQKEIILKSPHNESETLMKRPMKCSSPKLVQIINVDIHSTRIPVC